MTTIEIMLEALKSAQSLLTGLDYADGPVDQQLTKAIAAGEAELRREPDGWMREDNSGNEGPSAVFEAPSKHMITCAAKCGEKYEPVWTREEIK
ncbi:hypothetical protein [Propionivibrio sp.]|uniref:hypothetical protein n=1 Tax=Propionivibrio sp. TaxID=2212460 RepID=UPI003BF3A69F